LGELLPLSHQLVELRGQFSDPLNLGVHGQGRVLGCLSDLLGHCGDLIADLL